MFKKVALAVSGGVDSAVAGLLLKSKGYDVHGVFMQNWDLRDETGYCSSERDYEDARIVCGKLDIPLQKVNFVKQYWNEVFLKMISDYENGHTPNPDVLCNRHVKFDYFYDYARERLKADAIATGHYACTSYGGYLENYSDTPVKLLQCEDSFKDQTFFLCLIKQRALRRTMFPLGRLLKADVKKIAFENGLEDIARKKESMGICFIGDRNFQEFIEEYVDNKPGEFIDISTGKTVGTHNGIHQWTVGQRTRIPAVPHAYYVAKKDKETNAIYVAMGTKHTSFYSSLFFTEPPQWITAQPAELRNKEVYDCLFKFQHTHLPVDCRLFQTDRGLVVLLWAPKRAVTSGQYAVFYKDNVCLGGAKIAHPGTSNFMLYWLQNNGRTRQSGLLSRYYSKEGQRAHN